MTKASDNFQQRRQGIGISLSASPPMRELKDDVAAKLQAGVPEDEVRAYLAGFMVDHDDFGIRAMIGLNRKVAREPVGIALVKIAQFYAKKLKRKSIRSVLVEWTQNNDLDTWVADYTIGWAKSGEPPALEGKAARAVGTIPLGTNKEPVVFMFAGALCDPEEAVEQFMRTCAQAFPPETWMRKGFAERDARRFKAYAEGQTDFEIAKSELDAEGWPSTAANKREYNAEVKKRANSVLQSRKRWDDYMTRLLDSPSRNTD